MKLVGIVLLGMLCFSMAVNALPEQQPHSEPTEGEGVFDDRACHALPMRAFHDTVVAVSHVRRGWPHDGH